MKTNSRGIVLALRGRLMNAGGAARASTAVKQKVTSARACLALALFAAGLSGASAVAYAARDPGVRGGDSGGGGPMPGLTAEEQEYFNVGKNDFEAVESVVDGLGPRMNLDSCGGCHSHPATGGSSPAINPQVAFAAKDGGTDRFPSAVVFSGYASPNGPIREVRFKYQADGTRDGGVHNTATISGRLGANGCTLALEDFAAEFAKNNVVFRIPTPLFGAGLIEQIPDRALRDNLRANASIKSALGISGKLNRNGNDGSITRFGWKAQNKSLLLFAGEAYNVEMGISNELFQNEREEDADCQYAAGPNDATDTAAGTTPAGLNGIEKFAFFQRLLAPPTASTDTPGGATSIDRGRTVFADVGCALCHSPTLRTGNSYIVALSNKAVNLYSDLALHSMGQDLADDILQGQADGDQFRTAPLWGLGQRIFFLHDGRTSDLLVAIRAHKSRGSEANAVIGNFNGLSDRTKQDLLNFLRSL